MKTTALYLQSLADTKLNIKQALINKGQEPSLVFASYPLLILRIETGSDVDLSFVTASSTLILAGYIGADTNGSPVNGSILYKYSSDVALNPEGSINIPKGYYLNTEVTLPLSTTTVTSNLVTTTIGWSKGLTTIVGTLTEGGLINPATEDQTINKNSFLASDIVVKGLENFTLENIALGVTMWGKTGTFKGGTTVVALNPAGVLVDDGNGGLKVQKLNFDGTVASDNGEPITALNFYIFNTGKAEPDYNTGLTIDLSFITATSDKILSGYIGSDKDGNPVNGTIENGEVYSDPNIPDNIRIVKAGYYPEDVEVTIGNQHVSYYYTPGTEDIIIPDGSFINDCKVLGDSNFVEENIAEGVTIWGKTGTHKNGVNTSDATVTSQDIVVGKIAYGASGKVYGERQQAADGIVYLSNGRLSTMNPVYLNPGEDIYMYTIDGTVSPEDIAEGKTAYGPGGLMNGTMPKLSAGYLSISDGNLAIPVKGYFESDSIPMTSIDGIGDLAAENIKKGKAICGVSGTLEESEPQTSLEIYKCAEVIEATTGDGYVVSGTAFDFLNGTYTTTSLDVYTKAYKNEHNAYLVRSSDMGQWILMHDDFWFVVTDMNQETPVGADWNYQVGTLVDPSEIVVTALASEPSWSGYKYDLNTKTFADTLTEGLVCKTLPTVDKIYNADASISLELLVTSDIE